jgi:diguanylate cyclase (GGDEF)-like protein
VNREQVRSFPVATLGRRVLCALLLAVTASAWAAPDLATIEQLVFNDPVAAYDQAQQALNTLASPPDTQARLHLAAAEAAMQITRPADAARHAEQGSRVALDPVVRLRIELVTAYSMDYAGKVDEAYEVTDRAVALAQSMQDPALLGEAYLARAALANSKAKFVEALQDCYLASINLPDSGPRYVRAEADMTIGQIYLAVPDTARAVSTFTQAVSAFRANGSGWKLANALYQLGIAYYHRKELGPAREAFSEYRRLAHRFGDVQGVAYADIVLLKIELQDGPAELPDFEARTAAIEKVLHEASLEYLTTDLYLIRAKYARAHHQIPMALEMATKAVDVAVATSLPLEKRDALALRADLLTRLGRHREAAEDLRRAYDLLKDANASSELRSETINAFILDSQHKRSEIDSVSHEASAARERFLLACYAGGLILLLSLFLVYFLFRSHRLGRLLKELATTDPLTRLSNRRAICEALDREVLLVTRYPRPLVCAMVDIDHFKRINDNHGHPAGDQVIQQVAQTLAASLRQTDCVGRYGGEEFLLVLPNTTGPQAGIVLERVRAAIEALCIDRGADKIRFTASIGFAEIPGGGDAATILSLADQALYAAKSGGRNRVVAHRPADADRAEGAPDVGCVAQAQLKPVELSLP